MGIVEKHKQALVDVKTLKRVCGEASDYCGAWCNNDVLDDLLETPTRKNAYYHLVSLIERYFTVGAENTRTFGNFEEVIDTLDPEVYEIGKRYGLL